MSQKKTIVVLGATGAQGGGLARAILSDADDQFAVRAVTRDMSSAAALALAELGAEVVEADIGDEARMTEVLQGAYGAFLVTFYWAHLSPELEIAQIAGLARAAKAAGVEHVVWSTLEDTRLSIPLDDDRMPTLQEHYKVPHFDVKGGSNHVFADLEIPTTFLHTSFYWENFIHFGLGPARDADGAAILTLPLGDGRLACIGAEDIGRSALGIFRRGDELIGESVGIAGDHLSGEDLAAGLSAALGETVAYRPLTVGQFRGLGHKGWDDLGNMFQYNIEFEDGYLEDRDLEFTRLLNPGVESFDQWLVAHKGEIVIA
jgi:uncharacterized protein YbjT (DUF2867 family)